MYAGLRWSSQRGGTSIFKALCACSPDVFFWKCTWCRRRVTMDGVTILSRVQKWTTFVAGLCFHIHVPCQVVLLCCPWMDLPVRPAMLQRKMLSHDFPWHTTENWANFCQELSPFHMFHTRASMHLWPPLENTGSVTEEWFDEVTSNKEG